MTPPPDPRPTVSGYAAHWAMLQAGLRPDPPLQVDEWSAQHVMIPAQTGAAEPGRYRLERTPYARDVLRALSPEHPARNVVVMGCSQIMKTQAGLAWLCAVIARQPANAIVLQPTDSLCRRVADRFDHTGAAIPEVRSRLAPKKDRDSQNTMAVKTFRGGKLMFLTARSAANLSETAARWCWIDEVDRCLRELKGEGDPISLLSKRQSTFGQRAKSFYTSSPTELGSSRIEDLFNQGNRHEWHIPCPECGEFQTMEFERLVYDAETDSAALACLHCGVLMAESHKSAMLAAGEWRATAETWDHETWSYRLNALAAPLGWTSWASLCREHALALQAQESGDDSLMRVFVNTRLALPYSAHQARQKPEDLQAKAEPFPRGILPPGAILVTAGVDVQRNRLEILLVGWGPGPTGLECWLFDQQIIWGDPVLPETWRELDNLLATPIGTADNGATYIRGIAIDAGDGETSSDVLNYASARKQRVTGGHVCRVLATKGASTAGKPIIGRPTKVEFSRRGKPLPAGADLWLLGTDRAKDWLHSRLALSPSPIHLSRELPPEVFEQLLAEARATTWHKGRKVSRWELLRRGSRNEALDCFVYALAAAHHLGVPHFTEARWRALQADLAQADLLTLPPAPPQTADASPLPPPPKKVIPRPASGFGSADWNL